MDVTTAIDVLWGAALLLLLIVVGVAAARKRRHASIGSAAAGAIYDLQHRDKRRAIELIVEEKAEARRPEYPDGNLPELEAPKKP